MEHSLLPWVAHFYKESDTWGIRQAPNTPSYALEYEGESHELIPCGFSICNMVEQGPEGEANAQLIAKAVNAHDKLKRDGEAMRKALERALQCVLRYEAGLDCRVCPRISGCPPQGASSLIIAALARGE